MRAAILLAALAAAVLVAGCGGSGHSASNSSSAAAIGKAAFVARADTVCKASETALGPVLKRETATLEAKPPKRAAAATALEQASTIVADGLSKLQALPQPTAGRSLLASVYRALNEEAGTLHKLAADVRAGRAKAMSTDASEQTAFAKRYTDAAQTFGFKRCGARAGT